MLRKVRKGVSPLIAAVLLIVFTVAIGAVVLNWMTSYTKQTTNKAGTDTSSTIECAKQIISITKANKTSDGKYIYLFVTNQGSMPTTLDAAYAYDNQGHSCSNTSLTTINLGVGGMAYINISGCSNVNSNAFTVRVSNKCGNTDQKQYPSDFE